MCNWHAINCLCSTTHGKSSQPNWDKWQKKCFQNSVQRMKKQWWIKRNNKSNAKLWRWGRKNRTENRLSYLQNQQHHRHSAVRRGRRNWKIFLSFSATGNENNLFIAIDSSSTSFHFFFLLGNVENQKWKHVNSKFSSRRYLLSSSSLSKSHWICLVESRCSPKKRAKSRNILVAIDSPSYRFKRSSQRWQFAFSCFPIWATRVHFEHALLHDAQIYWTIFNCHIACASFGRF